jgi:hypothetical protein
LPATSISEGTVRIRTSINRVQGRQGGKSKTYPDACPGANIKAPPRLVQRRKEKLVGKCYSKQVMLKIETVGFTLEGGQQRLR